MECQNLPYTCDLKGAQNEITMGWDGKQFVIDVGQNHQQLARNAREQFRPGSL